MKHIFVINNSIVDIISKAIIKEELQGVNVEDIIILEYRGYKSEMPYNKFELPLLRKSLAFWETWKDVIKVKSIINTLNDNYILYVATTGFEPFQLLLTRKCVNYCYIEEGLASYFSLEDKNEFHYNFLVGNLNLLKRVLKKYFHVLNFGWSVKFFSDFYEINNPKYLISYCTSDLCFFGHKSKKILKISFDKASYLSQYNTVLVLEPFVEVGLLKLEDYLKGLKWVLNYLNSNKKEDIYVKFHPEQFNSNLSKKAITQLFNSYQSENKVNLHVIPMDIKLENIAFNNENSEFYFILSSIAIYANNCGRPAYSFYKVIEADLEEDHAFIQYIRNIPKPYFAMLTYLK